MTKSRLPWLTFLFVNMCLSVTALADSQPVHWEAGTVHLQGDRVSVKFADGTSFEVANARVVPDHHSHSGAGATIELTVPSSGESQPTETFHELERRMAVEKGRLASETMFGLVDLPAPGNPIAGLKVIRLRTEGATHLIWVIGEQTLSDPSGYFQGRVFSTPYEQLDQGRIGLQSLLVLKKNMAEYPNELAVVQQAKKRFMLIIHDNWASSVHMVMLTSSDTEDSLRLLNSGGSEFSYPLPASFERGKPFAEAGELLFLPAGPVGSLVLKPRAGEPVRFALGDSNMSGDLGAMTGRDYFERYKLMSRLLWERGDAAIRALLSRQGGQAPPTSKSVLIRQQLADWMNRASSATASAVAQQSDGSRRKDMEKIGDVLVLTLSKALHSHDSSLRSELATGLLDAAPGKTVFYLRLPSTNDVTRYKEAVVLLSNQIAALGTAGQDTLLILDTIDAQVAGTSHYSGREAPLSSLFDMLSTLGVRRTRIAFLGRPEQVEAIEALDPYMRARDVLAIDALIAPDERAALVQKTLSHKGYEFERAVVERLLAQIERESANRGSAFADLSAVARNLSTVFYYSQLKPESAGFYETTSRMYAQITGDRRIGPFPADVLSRLAEIPRQLSTGFPGHSAKAMSGRDWLLRALERKVTTWLAYGHKEHPVLPLFFAGDHGTGKTMTASGIAEVLGAAVETVNLSALARKGATSYYSSGGAEGGPSSPSPYEAELLRPIQEKVERLVLSPNPVKVLILDELHTTPGLLNALLPALGNDDRKAPGVLNLDGIIVIMIANVDTASTAYAPLSQLLPGDPLYPQAMFQLFKDSLAGARNAQVDDKLVASLAGRLLPGMFFFPPLGLDHGQQDSLIEKLVSEYEAKNNMRLVLQASAREHLMKIAASYTDGNYRAVERALREEITSAFARFMLPDPSRKLEGYFVLGAGNAVDGRVELAMLKVEGDNTGSITVVHDSYARFTHGLATALGFAVESLATGAAGGDHETGGISRADVLKRSYTLMADAFTRAASTPLFERPETGARVTGLLDELALPKKLAHSQQALMSRFFAEQVRGLFTAFADYHQPSGAMKTREQLLQTSERLGRVLSGLVRLNRIEAESSDADKPFARWVESMRGRYVAGLEGPAAALIAPGSIEALSIAAGYLTSDLGRHSADVLLTDLRNEAKRRMLMEPSSGHGAAGGALMGLSNECERLLKGGAVAAEELDKLLGKN